VRPALSALSALALAVALPLVASTLSCTPDTPDWRAQLAAWKHPDALPAFPLVDDTGRAFTLDTLKGEPVFIGFVFTRCPVADACPLTMARLKELERIAPSRRILVVTLDPGHDTPPVLAAFKKKHGVQFMMATGTKEVIEALTSLFNVVALTRGGPESGDIGHPVKLALLDKDLRPVHEWHDNNFDPRVIVKQGAPHAPAAQ
jgi:protein SCO1/2